MKGWYKITPEDLIDFKKDLSQLPKLVIGDTIHYDPDRKGIPDLDSIKKFLSTKYIFEQVMGADKESDWTVLAITGYTA